MKTSFKRCSKTSLLLAIPAALILLINSLILRRLDVGWGIQAAMAAFTVIFILTGRVLLGRKGEALPDCIMTSIISFILGLIFFTGLNFFILHLHHPSFSTLANIGFFVFFPLAAWQRRKTIFKKPFGFLIGPESFLLILFLSLLLSFSTAYGFQNNPEGRASRNRISSWSFLISDQAPVPNWGWNKDKYYWLGSFVADIQARGLPGENLLHNGVQVCFFSLSRLFPASPLVVTQVYKGIAFALFFSLLYAFAYLGKRFFHLGKAPTILLILAVPFFAAINYPFYPLGKSSYLGFFPVGGSFFHSVTQFMSLVIGMGGVILVLEGAKQSKLTPWGCLMTSGSFFFKPSFFAVTALPLAAYIWLVRDQPRKIKILSSGLLLFPALFWKIYPLIYRIPQLEVPLAVKPFQVMFHYAFGHFHPSIRSNDYLFALLIILFSFAVFIPIGMDCLLSRRLEERRFFPRSWRRHLPAIFLTASFLLGVASYAFLIQDSPQKFHANLSWGAGIGYLLFLPILLKLLTGMKRRGWRIIAGIIFTLHLWGGIYHLYRFTVMGMIY